MTKKTTSARLIRTCLLLLLLTIGLLLTSAITSASAAGPYDVKNYGARLDGVTDDTNAINSAISAAAAAGGGKVVVPSGVALVDAARSVNLKSGVTLSLAPDAVLRAKPNSLASYAVVNCYNVSNVVIEGGTIQGERQAHTGTTGVDGYAVRVYGSSNVIVRNLVARDAWGHGINVNSTSSNVTVSGVKALNNRCQGMLLDGKGISVSDSEASQNLLNGITLRGSDSLVTRTIVRGNQGAGIVLTKGSFTPSSDRNEVSYSTIDGNGQDGILGLAATNTKILYNTVTGNGGKSGASYGNVVLRSVTSSTITGNYLRTSGTGKQATYGLYLTSACQNNTFSQNDVRDSGTSAIFLNQGTGNLLGNLTNPSAPIVITPPSGGTTTTTQSTTTTIGGTTTTARPTTTTARPTTTTLGPTTTTTRATTTTTLAPTTTLRPTTTTTARPTTTTTRATTTTTAPSSSGTINVKNYGAKGDGSNDDTDEINAAITAAPSGSVVYLPAGTYMVDAAKSVKLKSNITFRLDAGATIKAKGNSLGEYQVVEALSVSNLIIEGGTIQGDRYSHSGSSGEHGHNLAIVSSSNVTVRNMRFIDAWGDGLYIGWHNGGDHRDNSRNVTVDNIVAENNRRNGLSITGLIGGVVKNSIFRNQNGTSPEAGVDVEPDVNWTQSRVSDLEIVDSEAYGNKGIGFNAYWWQNSCNFTRLYSHDNALQGFVLDGTNQVMRDCRAERNSKTALTIRGNNIDVIGGSFSGANGATGLAITTGPFSPTRTNISVQATVDGKAVNRTVQ